MYCYSCFDFPSTILFCHCKEKSAVNLGVNARNKHRIPAVPIQRCSSDILLQREQELTCFSPLVFSSGYLKAKQYMDEENYDKIISECTKEIDSGGRYTAEALLLRATFYLLIGNATAAQPDLDRVINMQDANVKVGSRFGFKWLRPTEKRKKNYLTPKTFFLPGSQLKANALIKRGSMYMQQQQSLLSTQDFNMAADMDTRNPDVYHHRGQVGGATQDSLAELSRQLVNINLTWQKYREY